MPSCGAYTYMEEADSLAQQQQKFALPLLLHEMSRAAASMEAATLTGHFFYRFLAKPAKQQLTAKQQLNTRQLIV